MEEAMSNRYEKNVEKKKSRNTKKCDMRERVQVQTKKLFSCFLIRMKI